jgi:hypothetical protein
MEQVELFFDLELTFEDELCCESRHRNSTGHYYGPCTVQAVARWAANCPRGRAINVCSRVVQYVDMVRESAILCEGCKRLAGECWSLRPL